MKKNRAMNAFLAACIFFVGVGAGIQTSQAAVLFDISGGGVPLFSYGTATDSNNVVNVPGQPAGNNTGSTIVDASNTANWIGSIGGGSPINSVLSFTGLIGTVTVQWTYVGSESGDQINFKTGAINFTETDINNNNSNKQRNRKCELENHQAFPRPQFA